MESPCKNSCSVIQYHKGNKSETKASDLKVTNSFGLNSLVENDLKVILSHSKDESITTNTNLIKEEIKQEDDGDETNTLCNAISIKVEESDFKAEPLNTNESCKVLKTELDSDAIEFKFSNLSKEIKSEPENKIGLNVLDSTIENRVINENKSDVKNSTEGILDAEIGNEIQQVTRGKKRKLSNSTPDNDSTGCTNTEDGEANYESVDSDFGGNDESDKSRKRGRKKRKKSSDAVPSHLSSDMVLGYKMLVRFLETPQFSGFLKPSKRNTTGEAEESKITCLNQIKKKFEDNSYKMVCEFVNDIREMLTNIYESRNPVAIKRALRLEQVLEQRIAQLPNYLRPQCALVLPPDDVNNSHNKIRISKGGGFVSLLLEKTEKQRYEKNKEKRKILAEERKQMKEEQDKDVQEWEKNVLLKDFEEEIKSMWELPAIGHFIHLCADILNIGEVAQFEVERMLLMPECSDTLDLIMTALLTNSLMRAKLDRTPSMPYSIWGPLVRTRVMSWYRTWQKEGRNEQKLFEEIGIEPEFWSILGPEINPLDYYYFHEISLLQRVWILKTLCDVDFVRKKTVHDNIRLQALDELNPNYLGIDRHGNRYIQLKQFCASDIRIYRQSSELEGGITMSEFVDNFKGFEHREGPITAEKVFRDIWELNDKQETKIKKKKVPKTKKPKNVKSKAESNSSEKKNLRRSVREKQKTYVDWSESDQSDTDLDTLKKKLTRADADTLHKPFSDREFISLSVFRLPRDKVTKLTPKKSGYVKVANRQEGPTGEKSSKTDVDEGKEDQIKLPECEDEQSDSLDAKQMQEMQSDFEKTFHGEEVNGDEFDGGEKLDNFQVDKVADNVNFTVKNLDDLKIVFKKGSTPADGSEETVKSGEAAVEKDGKNDEKSNSAKKENDTRYRYNVPNYLKPDSSKFYLVVDSVEGLRQLISKFGSHENDLEIITRGTKSKKKVVQNNRSCEVELIEKLQNLLVELEPWELDFMKSHRSNKEKMYKEYMNFINRPPDFVHPNESYWVKSCEEPASTTTTTSSATATTATTTTTTAGSDGSSANADKSGNKETTDNTSEVTDPSLLDPSLEVLAPRRRTRVTRLQIQPTEDNDTSEDYDDADDYESNESDDNWVMPTSKKKAKKEVTAKTPKFPRRSATRKAKASALEKIESNSSHGEKAHNSSPDKTKKALFWGPRSSDPSEDLNWEKNRQKILEQHNSPVKKAVLKPDVSGEVDGAVQKSEELNMSLLTTSPKRLITQIPGNKKPYFSSAQLKAMENQAKQSKPKESEVVQQKTFVRVNPNVTGNAQQVELHGPASNSAPEFLLIEGGNKAPMKIHTLGRLNNAVIKQSPARSSQNVNKAAEPTVKQTAIPVIARTDEPMKIATQIRGQVPSAVNCQKLQGVVQQKGGGQVEIQIQEPTVNIAQGRVVAAPLGNLRLQQPLQWQPKVITVNQQGKIVQHQLQTPTQLQIQSQSQVQLQNVPQGQVQQVVRLEPAQKWTAIQQPVQQVTAEKTGQVQQVVITDGQSTSGTTNTENDLYLTDGKHLIKFDTFFQQSVPKDKVLAVNVNEKLDLKKPLLIVKKPDGTVAGTLGQGESSASSQQNVLFLNKPTTVQQTVVPTSLQNIVIPTNYIVKEGTQVTQQNMQKQQQQQTVKIVQQAPTYIIQQKAVPGKSQQPQIIKIITSQPMSSNQGLILSPGGGGQVLRAVTQSVVTPEQQAKTPTTLRFLRPSIGPTTPQAKGNAVGSPIILNNIIHIRGQDVDGAKPQMVAGRLVGTQQLGTAGGVPQNVKLVVSNPQSQGQNVVTTVTLSPQTVRLAPNSQQQNLQTGLRVVASGQSSQEQTIVASLSPQVTVSTTDTTTQALRLVPAAAQSFQVQSHTSVASPGVQPVRAATVSGQPVRLATVGPNVKIIANNLGPRVVRQVTPGKTTVITSTEQASRM